MGMYTELNLGICFKSDTPKDFIDAVKYMTSSDGEKDWYDIFQHKLFVTSRWSWMLRSNSYYFDALPTVEFEYDDISGRWYLTVITNLKNYSDEIEHFLDWISPYVETEGFAGYKRYEEDEHPTLIYFKDGKVSYTEIGEK